MSQQRTDLAPTDNLSADLPNTEELSKDSPNGYRSPESSPKSRKNKRFGSLRALALFLVIVLAVAGAGVWYVAKQSGLFTGPRLDLSTHVVKKEKLQLTVVERGALESAENADVLCRVKAGNKGSTVATTIKWVIDDGSHVKRGQLVAELDDSGLQEQLKTQRITADKARADWIKSEEDYKITESQNVSDIKNAETAIELARLDLEKYKQGEYLQTQKDILGRASIAEADLDSARDRASWSERMVKKGYFTPRQADAEKSRLRSSEVALDKVREESRVLEDYTYKRNLTDLESKLAESKRALDRIKAQANAKEVSAYTDRATKKSIFEQEDSHLKEIEEEIKKCTIVAPQDGMVVYYLSEQSRFGSGSQQSIIAQGEPVREGQKLMRIPDLTKMQVNTKVHEALVSRVKGELWQNTGFTDALRATMLPCADATTSLLGQVSVGALKDNFKEKDQKLMYAGQPAKVRVDAFPDRVLNAHVKTVATVASQQDWMSADVKVYQTIVSVDESVENLKPGMSAEVTILVDNVADHVLAVPVQAIMPTAPKRSVYVMTQHGPEKRDVEVGLSNEKFAEIRSGIEEGEEVILNWRNLLTEKERGKVLQTPNKVEFKGAMPQVKGKDGKAGGQGAFPGNGSPGMGGPSGGMAK